MIIVIGLFGFFTLKLFLIPKTEIIKAELSSNQSGYPESNYFQFQNKTYLVREIYKYDKNILNEYWFVSSEGFAVEKLGLFENEYSNEQKPYKYLNLETGKDNINFNGIKYKIEEQKADTIISKIDTNELIIFITKN